MFKKNILDGAYLDWLIEAPKRSPCTWNGSLSDLVRFQGEDWYIHSGCLSSQQQATLCWCVFVPQQIQILVCSFLATCHRAWTWLKKSFNYRPGNFKINFLAFKIKSPKDHTISSRISALASKEDQINKQDKLLYYYGIFNIIHDLFFIWPIFRD